MPIHYHDREGRSAYPRVDLAGQLARALPSALLAAERARAQSSLEIAAQQDRIAGRGSAAADESTRNRKDPQTESQVLLAEGVRRIYAGDLEQAVEVLEQAHRVTARAGIRHAWVAAILPWLTTTPRKIAEEAKSTPAARGEIGTNAGWKGASADLARGRDMMQAIVEPSRETA